MKSKPPVIVLAGAGLVAGQLGARLQAKGLPVAQVISRTPARAEALGQKLQIPWSTDWSAVRPDADWVLMAVSDDAIGPLAAELARAAPGALLTHTSGATPGAVLAPYAKRYGVFYPLQSFSASHAPVWSKIPFCLDAASPDDLIFLKKMARKIGRLVYTVDDAQRAVLHAGAVFANNFTNRCFVIAEKILKEANLPFNMLHPLMEETLVKALRDGPLKSQTGPARRADQATMARHLALLAENPEWQAIYQALSDDIHRDYK